jgi:23S rRNA U2552 (ribose-2'-O)-methylase RlmE/FtsJ
MTTYKFTCKDINLCITKESCFKYQDINYNILEKDINNICKRINGKPVSNKSKVNQITELITYRLNKQYHNLSIIDKDLLDDINKYKTLISKNSYTWNKHKLFTNDYEMVYNSKYSNNSIANKKPLSRSYFKMIEIANKYLLKHIRNKNNSNNSCNDIGDYINNIIVNKSIKSLHLAEGPGGFIEALIDMRKMNNSNTRDLHYGISLTTDKNIPGWDKSVQFLKEHRNVNIITGMTGNGDLINIDNIRYLHTRLGGKMDIITADGGFNFSINHYIQEYNASLLIFAELVAALGCLSVGGTYIYKIYDMSYKITADILFIAQCFFTEIELFKPLTSRAGNSEKYVICSGFKGISKQDLCGIIALLDVWIKNNDNNNLEIERIIRNKLFYEKNDYKVENISIIDSISVNGPQGYYNLIVKINKLFNDKQIENIKKTMNVNYNNQWVSSRKAEQRELAIKWCQDNNISYY